MGSEMCIRDRYSGLLDLFEAKGMLTKQGNRLKYTTTAGEEMLEFRKGWTRDKLQAIMDDISNADGLSIDEIAEAQTITAPNGDVVNAQTGEVLEEAK